MAQSFEQKSEINVFQVLWLIFDSFPVKLAICSKPPSKDNHCKRLIQEYNSVSKVQVEPRSLYQSCLKIRGGHLRRNNCGATISLAIALAPQLFLDGCADGCTTSILAILSAITQAQVKYDYK